jgi:GT2 family glycosyltransferase
LGHQEEVDFQIRLRLGGWISAQDKEVQIVHHAKATGSPDQQARIAEGVKAWVEKWEKYHGGQKQGYHSTNVLRFELWPTTALYMEEIFKQALPGLNDNPETVRIAGREYDLIKVPRLKDFYRGRFI